MKRSESQANLLDLHLPSQMIGLANLGNTCFMSSSIQCIINSPLFRDYIMQESFEYELENIPPNRKREFEKEYKEMLIYELSKLVKLMKDKKINDPINPVRPYELKKLVDKKMPQFSGYE